MRKGCAGQVENRNFTSIFDDRTSFRAKWFAGQVKSQFYISFGRSNLISCERGRLELALLLQFSTIEPHFVRKGCAGRLVLALLPQFLTIELHFVRKGCAGQVEIAILLQFLTIEPHFVRNGSRDKWNRNFTLVFDDQTDQTSFPGGPFDREKGGQRPFGQMASKKRFGLGIKIWPWKQDLAVKKCAFGRGKALNSRGKPWKTWNCRRQCEWPWKQRMAVNISFRGRERYVHVFCDQMAPQVRAKADDLNSHFYFSSWRSNLISCERVARDDLYSHFYFSFWRSNLISCERVARDKLKSQFYLSFWWSNLISCAKVARDDLNSHFYLSFWRSNLISCERVALDDLYTLWLQFLTIEPHFVRKGCAGQVEIAILLQFLTIEPHFVRNGSRDKWNRNFTSVLDDQTSFRAKGLRGRSWNHNFIQFLAIEPRFVRKGCVSSRRWHCPCPRLQKRIE